MIIKGQKAKFTITVDKTRRIVHEKPVGSWTEEQYQEYADAYKNKVIPYLGKGPWAKYCDLKELRPNVKVTPELVNAHIKYAVENGLSRSAILAESATVKMQMNRAGKNANDPVYFDNEKKADEWLKSEGF